MISHFRLCLVAPQRGRFIFAHPFIGAWGDPRSSNTKLSCASVFPCKGKGYWRPLTGLHEDSELRRSMRRRSGCAGPSLSAKQALAAIISYLVGSSWSYVKLLAVGVAHSGIPPLIPHKPPKRCPRCGLPTHCPPSHVEFTLCEAHPQARGGYVGVWAQPERGPVVGTRGLAASPLGN